MQDHLVVHLRYRVGKEAGSLNWIGGDKSNRESVYPGNGKAVANGHANGNGHTNGYANGHANGHANGNGTAKTSVVAAKQKSTGPSSLDKAVMKLRFAGAMVRWLFGFRGALTCNVRLTIFITYPFILLPMSNHSRSAKPSHSFEARMSSQQSLLAPLAHLSKLWPTIPAPLTWN